MQKKHYIILHFIIIKLNVHEKKKNLHSKIANFNYKVTVNCIKIMKYLMY